MGKSNKFDYSNRPNSGAKLGQIIARDLEKEAEKVIKDADKHAAKARKVSTGSVASISSGADGRDGVVHTLDIKVSGKKLGDDGACALAEGLERALQKGTARASILLEDLALDDNAITTTALARLAPIIVLARHDLKTINLSSNSIKVHTAEEAVRWEAFLRSFKGCFKLRRLDLSGNVTLGAKAMEILARVHGSEQPINPIPATGSTSVESLGDVSDSGVSEGYDTSALIPSLANATFLRRRCGLRSIPYLTLSDIGLDDAGALWLSYVIEDHHFPNQLLDSINAARADSLVNVYQQGTKCQGLDWFGNERTLGKDGFAALKMAEGIREQKMLLDEMTGDESIHDSEIATSVSRVEFETKPRRSSDHRYARAARGDRRASIRSIHTNDGGEHEVSELDSIRRKLQRSVIASRGASSVDLWRVSLRIANSSRVLSGIGPTLDGSRRIYTGPFVIPSPRPDEPRKGRQSRRAGAPYSGARHTSGRKRGSYAATLAIDCSADAGDRELGLTDVTNSVTTSKMVLKPHRKEAVGGSHGGDLQTVTDRLKSLATADPQRFFRAQEERVFQANASARLFRDRTSLSHFPADVAERIARFTADAPGLPLDDNDDDKDNAHERWEPTLLSRTQRRAAFAWGHDRTTLDREREWCKLADSSQVWTLLESIGCLEYEQE